MEDRNMTEQISGGEMVIYTTGDGDIQVQVDTENETLWLTQKAMAQLFGVGIPAISKHLVNIFSEGELEAISVISKMETTASDGKNYQTTFYNLDAILTLNRKELLEGCGIISKALADKKVETEYNKYQKRERETERLESIKELDRDIKALNNK